MSLSRDFLERCAAETGFRTAALEQVVRLGELAADVGRHPLLGRALALKGGTALNLCYGEPRRLSVDLDFNYVAGIERARMLADRPELEAALEQLSRRQGYRVQRSRDEHAGCKLYLEYPSALGGRRRLQIDLNFLFRLSFDSPARRRMWQPGGLDEPELPVVGLDEISIGKLIALLDRCAARDVYDASQLATIAGVQLSSPGFRARFIALSAILNQPLPSYGRERLDRRLSEERMLSELLPMLKEGERPAAGELLDQAWSAVAPLVRLTPAEAAYVTAAQEGDLRLDLLFPADAGEARRLGEHPALQWKIQNARRGPRR
jgi:predicted nucleotidyltransferase component of viral defense system